MEIEAQFRESYFSNIKRVRNPVSVIRVTFISQKKKKKGGKNSYRDEIGNKKCTLHEDKTDKKYFMLPYATH